jgi:uncharacterized protein (DUF433 family)/DNA-binding transcriptional MerR regulator
MRVMPEGDNGTVRPLPPRGHYLAHEAGWLAGVSGVTVGQWARRGYIRSSQSSGRPRVYSYQDAAEAMVVHELLLRDVVHRDIKRAIQTLRTEYGDWPLTHARLATSEGGVFAEHGGFLYDVGKRGWQQTVNEGNLELIATQLNRGGWVVRKLPHLHHIEVNPDWLSGNPTIRGRRLSAVKVARLADTRDGRIVLTADYALRSEEIEDAARWWTTIQELSAAQYVPSDRVLVVDEDLNPKLVHELRGRGRTAIGVRDIGLAGQKDPEVILGFLLSMTIRFLSLVTVTCRRSTENCFGN